MKPCRVIDRKRSDSLLPLSSNISNDGDALQAMVRRILYRGTCASTGNTILDLDIIQDAAISAAKAAASVIERHRQDGSWSVSLKQDDSPVTEVDIAAEYAIREVLSSSVPGSAFYGEETGHTDFMGTEDSGATRVSDGSANLRWLVDPIDGTKSFIRRLPYYSTQIACQWNGELVCGVSNAAEYGQQLVAVKGRGARLNGQAVEVRGDITAVEGAYLSSGNLTTLARDADRWQRYGELVSSVRRVRGYGDFCHYHQLCCGQADLIVESDVNILDIAALTVAVREAGGVITDLDGQPIDLHTTSVLAASTTALHQTVLSLLSTSDSHPGKR